MKIGFLLQLSQNDIEVLLGKKGKKYRQSFLLSLSEYYINKGHEVIIITTSSQFNNTEFRITPSCKIHIVKINSHGNLRALCDFSAEIRRIAHVLKNESCNVIHANWCYEFAMASLIADSTHTLITLHDWPDIVCPLIGNYFWRKRQKLGNAVLKKAKNLIAVSPYIKELYNHKYNGKIEVIPNFISHDLCVDTGKKNFRGDCPVIISINNGFDKRKNVQSLILAFDQIRKTIPNAKLKLVGAEYEKTGKAHRWVLDHISDEGISFCGSLSREQTLFLLKKSDILIHPSLEESFGMTLIEAMASKTAVIAGDHSGAVPWVLGFGKYGVLTDILNPNDIAECTIRLCNNLSNYINMTEHAFCYVKKKFLLETVAEQYLDKYRRIASIQ